jgi:hypothetical protein
MAIAWASEQSITQLTSVVNTEQQSVTLDLTAAYLTKCELDVNSDQATPTDALIWRVYHSNDDTDYDEEPGDAGSVLPPDTNNYQKTIILPGGLRYVKFGVLAAGATDTYVVDVRYQRQTAV